MAPLRQSKPVKRYARPIVRMLGLPIGIVAAGLLRLSGRRAGIALIYHSLASRTGDPAVELVPPHGAALFEAQMRHLAHTYRVVKAGELPAAVARRRRGERFPVAVTFDDDLASHMSLALPILRRTGLQATFFVSGASLQGPFSFWWERLQRVADTDERRLGELFAAIGAELPAVSTRASVHGLGALVEQLEPEAREAFSDSLSDGEEDPYDAGLRAEGVRALIQAGMSIGFHTRRHHPLPTLDDGALATAFEEGRDELETTIGERLTVVGYPHGRADQRVAAAARLAGFEIGYTGYSRPVQPGDDPFLLGRVSPSYRSAGHFALQTVAALLHTHRTAIEPDRTSSGDVAGSES